MRTTQVSDENRDLITYTDTILASRALGVQGQVRLRLERFTCRTDKSAFPATYKLDRILIKQKLCKSQNSPAT